MAKLTNEEILDIVKQDRDNSLAYYRSELKDKYKKWTQLFEADVAYYDKYFPSMPGSSFVSRDIMVTVNTVLPDVVKLLTTTEPITISGRNTEDVDSAKKMQILCNYLITVCNNYYKILYSCFKESLIHGISVIKCDWIKEYEDVVKTEILTTGEIYRLGNDSNIEVLSSKFLGENETEQIFNVEYKTNKLIKNQPSYFVLPHEEFLYDPTAKSVDECNYIIHRSLVTLDNLKLKEEEGIFSNVSEVERFDDYLEDDATDNQYRSNSDKNKARKTVVLYEYWGKIDTEGTGRLKDVVVTFTGDVILAIQENNFDMYPFFIFSPFPDSFAIGGMGMAELVENSQNVKTALVREMLYHTLKTNDPRAFYKEGCFTDPEQLTDGSKFISVDRSSRLNEVLYYEPANPLSRMNVEMYQLFDKERQVNSGVTETKQGITRNSNQTATEANIKYEASNLQVQAMCTNIAEIGLKSFYQFILYQAIRFIDDNMTIRILNETIDINPSEYKESQFDLMISTSIGAGSIEMRRNNANVLLQVLLTQALPLGLTSKEKILSAFQNLFEEMGFKDTDTYLLTEPEMKEQEQQQMQQMQQIQQQTGGLNGTGTTNRTGTADGTGRTDGSITV